jgi:hypothetical protein
MYQQQPYYQQAPPMPYQNYQAQQRQEQLNQVFATTYNYNYVKDRNEAEMWPIAPGNHLVFEDQNGAYFYTKSLGFAPNERFVFTVFKKEESVQPSIEEPKRLESEVDSLKGDIAELKELFKQFTTNKPRFDKKGGGK